MRFVVPPDGTVSTAGRVAVLSSVNVNPYCKFANGRVTESPPSSTCKSKVQTQVNKSSSSSKTI